MKKRKEMRAKRAIPTRVMRTPSARHNRGMATLAKKEGDFSWKTFDLDKFLRDANTVGEILRKNENPT